MKDNYTIIEEIYGADDSYTITINTPIGAFTGYTEPDEVDAIYPSSYHASEIALAKALRKYAEASANILKHDVKMLTGLINQAITFANGSRDALDNNSFRLINGLLKQKKKELELWNSRVSGLSRNIVNRIEARDKIVAKYIAKDKIE